MKTKFFIAIALLTLIACSDPKETVIPTDIGTWDKALKPSIEKLNDDEKKMFLGFTMRAKMGEVLGGKGIESGTTVGKAIDQQKKWIAEREAKEVEEKALKAKLMADQVVLKKQIDDLITVAVLELRLEKESYREKQFIKLGLQNKGTRDIRGISGSMKFIDIFDKEVGTVNFKYTDGLKAGSTGSWTGTRDYNQFLEEHKAVARLEEGKYKAVFEPEMIVFEDGTKLALKQ
jgi:hypothetical protein